MSGEEQFKRALKKLHPSSFRLPPSPLKPDPTNAFEVAMAERLKAMQTDIDELKSRLNWLLTLIVGAAVTNVVIALLK